ncbi:MAG: helix-turn-helix transcriptional regulator [Micavibrio sp.]|nr:helix-turn-helix transcriptional regulator [Micavibrio sp.]
MNTGVKIVPLKEHFPTRAPASLLPNEVEILELVAEGQSDPEIAQTLKISRHTVNMRMRRAFRKLGVKSRVVAVVTALQHGIIKLPELKS